MENLAPMLKKLRATAAHGQNRHYLAFTVGLTLALVATAWLPAYVTFGQMSLKPIAALYAFTGISLAALLIWGGRYWPAVWLAALVLALRSQAPVWLAFCVASGMALQAWVGCYLLQRLVGFRNSFNRISDVVGFVIFGMGISPLLGTATNVTVLALAGYVAGPSYLSTWWLWWLESATGILLIAPLLLVWFSNDLPDWPRSQVMEGIVLLILVMVVGRVIYGGTVSTDISNALTYAVFPLIIWAAIGFGQHGVVTVSLMVAAMAVQGTLRSYGPFYMVNSVPATMLFLYGFTTAVSVMGMLLAASISEYRDTNDALVVSEKKFRTLFDSASDAMFIHDLDGHMMEVNRLACDQLGYRRSELLSMQVAQIEAAEYAREYATRIAELQQVDHALFEIMHLHRNGTLIPVELSCRIIEYEGQQVVLTIARDITARRRLEEQLRQSQKMGAIGRLAGGIAHDFNNFLTVINGFSALILRTTAPNDPSYHGLELIAETGERAAGLVRKLLAFSRQQPVEMQVMNLGQVLNDMQTMLQRLIGEDVALRLVEAPGLGNIRADAGQMEQVVVNLAVNARDAMPTGGTLTISASNAELDAGFVALRPSLKAGRYVRLSVEDTGVGMSPEVQQHLFEPFFTTKGKEKGTGLGLPIVYGIVTQGAGHIEVESQLGQGTRVDVYLPVVEEVVKAAWSRAALGIPLGGDETLLVVEDEEGVRGLVVQGLRELGYMVLEAANAAEALGMCAASDAPIDLLLTDVIMPGMSGPELVAELHKSRPDLRILYMSGHTHETMNRYGIWQSGIPLVQKPFEMEYLAAQVRRVIDKAGE